MKYMTINSVMPTTSFRISVFNSDVIYLSNNNMTGFTREVGLSNSTGAQKVAHGLVWFLLRSIYCFIYCCLYFARIYLSIFCNAAHFRLIHPFYCM